MSESCLERDVDRGIHRLTMNHGSNALDRSLISELRGAIQELSADGAPPVLLTSAHKTIFSPGWNMKELASSSRSEIVDFLGLFNGLIFDVFSYPGPTAAAVGGHAVAGGCLLAMAFDLRFMSTGRARIGLAELNLGVPIPAGSMHVLGARLSPAAVDELVFGGDGFTAEEALGRGLMHRTVSPEALERLTDQTLRTIASKPRSAFVHSKRFLLERVWKRMAEAEPEHDRAFVDSWFEAETQKRIAATARELKR